MSGALSRLLRWCAAIWMVCMICWPSLLFAQEDARTLWHAYRGAEQEAIDAIVARWNREHPEAPFKALSIPYEAYSSKLTNAIPRGNGPDVFIAAHERTGEWSTADLVLSWTPEQAPFDTYHPRTNEALRFDDKQWGIPLAYKSLVLFYNTTLISTPPTTVEQLVAMATTHTRPDEKRYGLVYEASNFYMHAPWMHASGATVFDTDGAIGLNTPEMIASYRFADELVNTLRVVPEDASGTLVAHLFNSGQAAFAINGPWFQGELSNDLPYAIAPLPRRASTQQAASPFLTVEAAFVSAKSTHPEDARAFARHLAELEPARTRALKGLQPVATLAAYDPEVLAAQPNLSVFRQQLDDALPMPNRPEMNAVWEPANQALRQVLRGARTPESALAQAERRYAFYTRPAPEPRPIAPLLIGLGCVVCALLGVVFVRLRKRSILKEMRANLPAYLYLAPAVIGMLLLIVTPFVVGSMVSLFAHRQGEFTYVGLTHFSNIIMSREYGLDDPLSFYFTLMVTVAWTAINVFLHVSLGMMLALLLREPWVRLRGMYRVLLIIPWAIPNYITALIWKGMFHKQFGAINGLLVTLGLEPVSWFSKFSTAFAANVATNTWLGFPFMMVVILGALQAIPRDLEEAAEVDGATWWQRMRHIVFPLLRPSLVPAVILGTVWTFNMFNIIYLVSGGEPDGATEILISESYKWAFTRQQQYGYAAAYAVLIFFVLLAYSALTGQLKTDD